MAWLVNGLTEALKLDKMNSFLSRRKLSPGCCFARHLTINKTIESEGQSGMTVSATSRGWTVDIRQSLGARSPTNVSSISPVGAIQSNRNLMFL